MLHCRPLGAQYHLGLLAEAENPHDTATRSKRRWPPFREKQLGRHGKLCSGVLHIYGQFLPCLKLFYNILHMFGAFSVRPASDCQRVCCLLKSQGQFGQAKHDCGCLKVYTGKAKLYWDVVHFCTKQLAVFDGS